MARRMRALWKFNGAREGCGSWRESSRPGHEEPAHRCQDESMAEVSVGGDRKKRSGGNVETLRGGALKRGESGVGGRVISCSRGQERWRTKLELCRRESFDDDHRSAALGTVPQRVGCRSV